MTGIGPGIGRVYKVAVIQAFMCNTSHYDEMTLDIIRKELPNMFEDFLDSAEEISYGMRTCIRRWSRGEYIKRVVTDESIHKYILNGWNEIMEKTQ